MFTLSNRVSLQIPKRGVSTPNNSHFPPRKVRSTSQPSFFYNQTNLILCHLEITRMRKRRLSRTVNLLTGQTDAHSNLIASENTPSDVKYLPPVTHWHPNLTINLVDDHTPWVRGSIPAPLNECKLHHFIYGNCLQSCATLYKYLRPFQNHPAYAINPTSTDSVSSLARLIKALVVHFD